MNRTQFIVIATLLAAIAAGVIAPTAWRAYQNSQHPRCIYPSYLKAGAAAKAQFAEENNCKP
jgi:hypothetical protein